MKPILTRYSIENLLDSIGNDSAFIHIYFRTESKPEVVLPFILSFDKLIESTKMYDEKTYSYLSSIRKSIRGYGPKHSKVLQVIQEEQFDLEPHIIRYIESKDEQFVKAHYEWCERLQSEEHKEETAKIAVFLDKIANKDYRQHSMNLEEFKDQLDQAIHEVTLKHFPALFEKSKKHLDAYQEALIDVTLSFSSMIDNLMHDKFNPYWEENYEKNKKA